MRLWYCLAQAVRDEIRKLGIMGGGPAGAAAPVVYEVSDSEDEDFDTSETRWGKFTASHSRYLCCSNAHVANLCLRQH